MPPKVFLDEPFPSNLAVVGSCLPCNNRSSADEAYVACALELAATPGGDHSIVEREVVRRTFEARPALLGRLRSQLLADGSALAPEIDRIERVMVKLARGVWRYEIGEGAHDRRATVRSQVVHVSDSEFLSRFRASEIPQLLPEVGSRMMIRAAESALASNWQVVQPERFEYGVECGDIGRVRMLVRGYLAVEVDLAEADA